MPTVQYDFRDIADTDLGKFDQHAFVTKIYAIDSKALWEESIQGTALDEKGVPIEKRLKAYQWSLFRLLKLQAELSRLFVGYEEQIRMLLACAIAQEPVLFVGKPGVAKTELATSFFSGIGLRKPLKPLGAEKTKDEDNAKNNRANKYFEYLLSPFTVPEELFGPLDFKKLEGGTVHRINTNMLTGELVRGVFLDEIFNASSSILNTLLTLINERRYFDCGMFQDADLRVFIGASNHTPTQQSGPGDGMRGGKTGELEAFYDRFTIRLYFPTPQERHAESQVADIKRDYELIDKISRERFMEKLTMEKPTSFPQLACMNDILLIGRILGQIQADDEFDEYRNELVAGLALQSSERALCSMSPRKPNKLRPIMLADALLLDINGMRMKYIMEHGNDSRFEQEISIRKILEHLSTLEPRVTKDNLRVFHHIWDYEGRREQLKDVVNIMLGKM